VYSLTSAGFLTSIPTGNAPRGLALTPDAALLVVANSGDGTITIVDPDDPSSAKVVSVASNSQKNNGLQPFEVGTTNTNEALVILSLGFGSGFGDSLEEVDLSGLSVASGPGRNLYLTPSFLSSNRDGSSLLIASGTGAPVLFNSQSNTLSFAPVGGFAGFGAISADGDTLAAGAYTLTPQFDVVVEEVNWSYFSPIVSPTSDVLSPQRSLALPIEQ
jgi:DNA-binding beta-propeller fold protein YncE